ncbi:MAG: helix-turn-helix transcriptional regulator [Spirosomataceae bacterium]
MKIQLHEILRIHRIRKKLKQSEVAKKLGLKGSAYSNLENGKSELTVKQLIILYAFYGEAFHNDVLDFMYLK